MPDTLSGPRRRTRAARSAALTCADARVWRVACAQLRELKERVDNGDDLMGGISVQVGGHARIRMRGNRALLASGAAASPQLRDVVPPPR